MIWRGAWAIAWNEFRKIKFAHVLNLIMCFLMYSIIASAPGMEGEQMTFGIYMLNLGVLMVLQIFGLGFTRNYLGRYWSTDLFTKRTSFLKLMPIRDSQIVVARMIPIAITTLYMYTILYVSASWVGSALSHLGFSGSQFLAMVLVFMGYTIMVSGLYLYLELSFSGKIYFVVCAVWAVLLLGIVVFLSYILHLSLWEVAADWVRAMGLWAAVISLGAGSAVMALFVKLSLMRLKKRDLYS